jgi:hypothetical protein
MPEPQVQNQGEAVDKVTALLTGRSEDSPSSREAAPSADLPPADPEGEEGSGEPELNPTSLAEKLGLKPEELFSRLKIPVDEGEPLTLEEFKDAGKELRGLKAAQGEFAEQKVAHENSVMMQRQILGRALAKVPPQYLTEDVIAEVQQEQAAYVEGERLKLLAVRPDLKDPAKWNSTQEALVEHLTPYGFMQVEIENLHDHRMRKYVIDNAEREQRVKKLNADGIQVTEAPKLQAPSRSPAKPVRRAEKPKAATGPETLQDKAVKVAALLGVKQ